MRSVVVSPSRTPERLYPLVEDLEHSVQWSDLANNIGDLERNCSRRRTARKSRGYDNLERHTVRRRSMPEVQKADLVYVQRPQDENSPRTFFTPSPLSLGSPEPPKVNRLTWKSRSEFERSYFGEEALDDRPILESESRPMYQNDLKEHHHCTKGHHQVYQVSDPRNFPGQEICHNQDHQMCETKDLSNFQNENPRDFQKLDQVASEFKMENQNERHQDYQSERRESKKEKTQISSVFSAVNKKLPENLKTEKSNLKGSRERLQEIFEYNRCLRRQFFAEVPGNNQNQRRNTFSGKLVSPIRIQEPSKYLGIGFGSTETITSQSNQSADSSTNGRKSRADFSNTPDSVNDDKPFINVLRENEIQFESFKETDLGRQTDHQVDIEKEKNERNDPITKGQVDEKKEKSFPKVYFGMETTELEVQKTMIGTETYDKDSKGLQPLERFQCRLEDKKIESSFDPESSIRSGWGDQSRYQVGGNFQNQNYFPSKLHQSLPNLPGLDQPDSIARVSVNGSTHDLSTENQTSKLLVNMDSNVSYSAYTYKPLPSNKPPAINSQDDDSKYFATYVHTSNSSDKESESSTPSSIRKRKKTVPPPLDMSTVNERYERTNELERNYFVPTYTVDVTKVSRGEMNSVENRMKDPQSEVRKNDLIRHNELLKDKNNSSGDKNLLDFSSNISKSSSFLPKNYGESEQNHQLVSTSKNLNKSCCDLTTPGDLLSPQLVKNFKTSLAEVSRHDSSSSVINRNLQFERSDNSILSSRDCSPEWDQLNQISKHNPGNGTTLPLVYGPIPYSQYCDMKMSNLSKFLVSVLGCVASG